MNHKSWCSVYDQDVQGTCDCGFIEHENKKAVQLIRDIEIESLRHELSTTSDEVKKIKGDLEWAMDSNNALQNKVKRLQESIINRDKAFSIMSDIVAIAIAMGEEVAKHGDPGRAIYALRSQLEAANAKVKELEEENHNLEWALGAEGYETMATPEQQEEADAANRTAMELIEAIPKRRDDIESLRQQLAEETAKVIFCEDRMLRLEAKIADLTARLEASEELNKKLQSLVDANQKLMDVQDRRENRQARLEAQEASEPVAWYGESEDRRDAERYRMALSGHCNIEICELDDEGEWYGLAAMKNAKQYCDEKLDAAIEAEKVRTE